VRSGPGNKERVGLVDGTMNDIASLLHRDDTTVAVVGATDNPAKYGSVIYRDLKRKGFRVFAVNPNRDSVDGDPTYRSLDDLPERPTIVDIVVPPDVTLRVLEKAKQLGYRNVWVQPGAESPEVMAYLTGSDFNYLANACIMVESRVRAGQ
jgi:predicted CoA-binding protein